MAISSVKKRPDRRLFGVGTRLVLLATVAITPAFYAINSYLDNIENFLIETQQETLQDKSLTFSAILTGQEELFGLPNDLSQAISSDASAVLNYVWDSRNLVPRPLSSPIILDGNLSDWGEQGLLNSLKTYSSESLLTERSGHDPFSLSFQNLVGVYGDFLYALFVVDDESLVFRHPDSLNLERADHLQIGLTNPRGAFKFYKLAAFQNDALPFSQEVVYVNAFLMDENNPIKPITPENKIQAVVMRGLFGYVMELRIHKELIGDRLAFAIADVDEESPQIKSVIGTAGVNEMEDLGTILIGSPQISKILDNFNSSQDFQRREQVQGTRIWISDDKCTVRAYAGSLREQPNLSPPLPPQSFVEKVVEKVFSTRFFANFYRRFFANPPVYNFSDNPQAIDCQQNPVFNTVLQTGLSQVGQRPSSDGKTLILSAYAPIFNAEGSPMGLVAVERSIAKMIEERNRAIETLFGGIFFAFVLGVILILGFGMWLTHRIRKLSYDAAVATNVEGRVMRSQLAGNRWSDELGDLSRTISSQWQQMQEYNQKLESYNHYLSQYKDKLRHEMQTPASVIQSSLELLAMESSEKKIKPYIQRAQKGVDNLNHLLQNLSQAKNIEGAIENEKKEWFDLAQEVREHTRALVEAKKFGGLIEVVIEPREILFFGVPWLIRQMLDKVLENAFEFGDTKQPIMVQVKQEMAVEKVATDSEQSHQIRITISNLGSHLPQQMKAHIFDFMVSVRPNLPHDSKPHLGLGLYMAKLITRFHNGLIWADNFKNAQNLNGVAFTMTLPILSLKNNSS